jgi:hypothetical protein
MRSLFLGIISVIMLLSGCGMNTNQSTNNANTEEPVNLENLETFIKATQEGENVHLTLVLQNNSSQNIELTFSSGQQFEIVVVNENNEEVYRYSKDKMFTQAIESKLIKAGSQLEWQDVWETSGIQKGSYYVKAQIIAKETNPAVSKDQLAAETSLELEENRAKENTAFQNINVTGENGNYIISGEARVFEAIFNYRVSNGHSYLIEDYIQVHEGAPSWSKFELEVLLNEEQLPENGTVILELFEQSAKDGSDTNQLFIPLESF